MRCAVMFSPNPSAILRCMAAFFFQGAHRGPKGGFRRLRELLSQTLDAIGMPDATAKTNQILIL